MTSQPKIQGVETSRLKMHRSSLFEVPTMRRPTVCGSSITSFAYEPRNADDELQMKPPNKVQYENTYRMDPPVRFQSDKVTAIIKKVLQDNLEDMEYDPITCGVLSKTLAQEIKFKVKELDFQRYKIVSLVTIGEKKEQGVRIGSRCVWDTDRDNSSCAIYESASIYAVGTVYALYYE